MRRLLTASDRSERVSVASAWPVHLSLVCAAALIAMAYRYRHGGLWMAGMAALPLFITRFSFERYAAARRTYDQMIQALGIVPEVAGLTTPGHGERTAVYAGALADELGLGSDERERVVTAARLHHIGYICVDDPDEVEDGLGAAEIARVGADILRETVFLQDVAGLVEAAEGGPMTVASIEAAIVRMASAFDELVGEDHDRARGAAAVVGIGYLDRAGARVARALHHLVFERPEIVDDAILAGLPVSHAAAAAGVTEPVRR